MKPTTARMLEELRQLTHGLVFSTEGDYYVDPFVWEFDEQGELTLDKLLEAEGYLEEVEIESVFPQSKQFPREQPVTELFSADKKQLELLSFLQSRCTEVQVYVVSKSDASCKWNRDHPEKQKVMEPFEGFPVILAETKTREWIGIAPEVHFDCSDNERLFSNYDPFREEGLWSTAFLFRDCLPMRDRADCYVRFDLESLLSKIDVPLQLKSGIAKTVKQRALQLYGEQLPEIAACQNQQISEAILALIAEIKELLMGMELWTRQFFEPDFHVERFVMRVADTKRSVLCDLADAAGFARVVKFLNLNYEEDFDENDETESTKQNEARVKMLDQWMAENLTRLRRYEVGCMSVYYLYNVGQNADGDWIGVTTVGIWT